VATVVLVVVEVVVVDPVAGRIVLGLATPGSHVLWPSPSPGSARVGGSGNVMVPKSSVSSRSLALASR